MRGGHNYEEKHLRRSRTGCSIGIRSAQRMLRQPKGDYGGRYNGSNCRDSGC